MKNRKIKMFCSIVFSLLTTSLAAQETYLPLQTEIYPLLDRLETKSGKITAHFFSGLKPVSRKDAVEFLEEINNIPGETHLSTTDKENIGLQISFNGEWTSDENRAIDSKKPFWKIFYPKQSDMFYVKTPDFFLSINPVFSLQGLYEKASNFSGKRLMSGRGFEVRGWISKKVGFYTMFTDNQEQTPYFVKKWIDAYQAVPGADYYKDFQISHYDYLLAKGYFDIAALKDKMHITFGYDKHFIGDGIRSLLLSDFAAGTSFLRINTKIWKIEYQNLFLELVSNYPRNGVDYSYQHKYAAIHTLSYNVSPRLNIGLFESVIFGNRDHFEYSYLNPIIFYRATQRQLGDPDNGNIGFSFKAIPTKNVQIYSQFLLDDFNTKYFFSRNGYWANKWALQLGAKYFDAFSIHDLDLQGELNIVRPYTYSHYDSVGNYTHFNQPLAHPLGANFVEAIGRVRYQIDGNNLIELKGIWYEQGIDTGNANYGASPFKNYFSASSTTGVPHDWMYHHSLISGVKVNGLFVDLCYTNQIKPNVFLDLGLAYRAFKYKTLDIPIETSNYFYGGLRVNISRRAYDVIF